MQDHDMSCFPLVRCEIALYEADPAMYLMPSLQVGRTSKDVCPRNVSISCCSWCL
jgi:hypothetical protein